MRLLPSAPSDPPALASLLYRYLFFAWLFRDASQGTRFERVAAWRHNQGCAHWLPVYMRRWLVLGLLCFALGWLVEAGLQRPGLSACFYVPSILSVHFNVVAGVAWLWLRHLPPPA